MHEEQAQSFMRAAAQHTQLLTRYAKSLTKDQDEAHDLYSDALIKCYDRILVHGFTGSFIAYLISAIKYNFYHAQRDKKYILPLSNTIADEIPEAEDDAEARSAIATTIKLFVSSHYPPHEYEVFDLHIHGLTYREIAFLTSYTATRAYNLIQRIRQEVKDSFGVKSYK